ncbi:MAG TPA: histidine phosphatase family protein [Candidatus Omnitrophota bacterium]|nr:histidine phosphatase family protein [Candidatus Omnitrophota bacterium]
MPTIILVRHGETHFNREKRVQGHVDSPLTLKGIEQAKAYGRTIHELIGDGEGWRIVSSPLGRCTQTTGLICEIAGLAYSRVRIDDRIKEVGTGALSGQLKSDLPPEFVAGGTGTDAWYFRCPGGESHADMVARLSPFLAEIEPGEKVIVVSHGVAGKVLRGLYCGLDPNEALASDTPQDAIYRLSGGHLQRLVCG